MIGFHSAFYRKIIYILSTECNLFQIHVLLNSLIEISFFPLLVINNWRIKRVLVMHSPWRVGGIGLSDWRLEEAKPGRLLPFSRRCSITIFPWQGGLDCRLLAGRVLITRFLNVSSPKTASKAPLKFEGFWKKLIIRKVLIKDAIKQKYDYFSNSFPLILFVWRGSIWPPDLIH